LTCAECEAKTFYCQRDAEEYQLDSQGYFDAMGDEDEGDGVMDEGDGGEGDEGCFFCDTRRYTYINMCGVMCACAGVCVCVCGMVFVCCVVCVCLYVCVVCVCVCVCVCV